MISQNRKIRFNQIFLQLEKCCILNGVCHPRKSHMSDTHANSYNQSKPICVRYTIYALYSDGHGAFFLGKQLNLFCGRKIWVTISLDGSRLSQVSCFVPKRYGNPGVQTGSIQSRLHLSYPVSSFLAISFQFRPSWVLRPTTWVPFNICIYHGGLMDSLDRSDIFLFNHRLCFKS